MGNTIRSKRVETIVKALLQFFYICVSVQSERVYLLGRSLSSSYTMGCPPVRGDNPRALASGLSYVQVDKHGITILYHLH